MRFNDWVSSQFLTEAELVTGRRYLKWKRVGATALCFIFLIMFAVAVLGQSSAEPDYQNYQPLSAGDVSKYGDAVLGGDKGSMQKESKGTTTRSAGGGYAGGGSSNDTTQVISRKDKARSEYVLPSGSRVPAILDGELNSQLAQSPVVALLSNGFSFQGRTILPAGTKLLGRVGPGQVSDRINVSFDQAVLPKGHQVSISATALMTDGSPEIVGELHSGRGLMIAGAIGSSFLAGTAAALQTNQVNMLGLSQPEGSSRNAILNGVAQATLEQGKRFGDEAQHTQGYVTVPSGVSFQVYFDREIDLSEALQ